MRHESSSRTRALLLAALLLAAAVPAAAQSNSLDTSKMPGKVEVIQKLDAQIPMDLQFRDDHGRIVRLGDYFKTGKPVLLNFMYYSCPMLCSMVLEGTTTALTELKLTVGKDFQVITVSIDPRDMPDQAALQKEKYVKRYGRTSAYAGWHFLTAPEGPIDLLTSAVGFKYAYDTKSNQFAHGTALIVLTPEGKVSKYFYGFEYKARDLRLGLVEASEGKIGTPTDQLLLLCYHYDPATGKYAKNAMLFVRAGGVATMMALGGFIFVMLRSERRGSVNPPNENDRQ